MKKILFLLFAMLSFTALSAQTWIWYPGDYEIWLGNEMNNRRTERGAFFPPFWKTDSHYAVVEFSKKVNLKEAEYIEIAVEGRFNLKIDGKLQFGEPDKFLIPAGEHQINIKVHNQNTPPSVFVNGKTIKSDNSWKATYEDKEWIDESGKASDTSATIYMDAGSWNFNAKNSKPSEFKLPTTSQSAVKTEKRGNGMLVDFGKETFGYITLKGLKGNGTVGIYYGESPEEALDTKYGETLDSLRLNNGSVTNLALNTTDKIDGNYTLSSSKAFRYVYISPQSSVSIAEVGMEYEYAPVEYKGSFRCDDEEINKIWDVGAYTMHLTTREFFIDGIKRDRWVWSGDAIQSYLMNYYLFFDSETVKRTIWLLRGKDPVTSHTNTIMDYTFFWFLSIYDYYTYSGDKAFVAQIYPRMLSMMEYVMSRTNKNGMVEGLSGDWVFVDWADFKMSKAGELSIEQLLFCRSLEAMAQCASLTNDAVNQKKYTDLANDLKKKLFNVFWSEKDGAFAHNRENGQLSAQITPYTNMFAVLFDYLNNQQKADVKKNVLLNPDALKITTPYMRFYELEALCKLGEQNNVLKEMKSYWGGMLREGATSFWEKYNPAESGTQHLAMYGRPYGKSLCHAWGAGPIYLLGKYYLGIQPTKEGYSEFEIRPDLGGLKWMEGSVPTPRGAISLFMDSKNIRVKSDSGVGFLYIESATKPKVKDAQIETLGQNSYRVRIEGDGIERTIRWEKTKSTK